ncbi:MAG: glycosyltransferase, partial [Gemmatimonadaceae bacterium]
VAIAAPRASAEDAAAMIRQSGVEDLTLFPAISRGSFMVSPSLVRWVRTESRRFDVVHIHGLFNPVSSVSIRAARRAGTAVVACPHGTLSRYTLAHRRTAIKRAYLWAIERANVEHADALQFTTSTERDEAVRHGIDFGDRAHIVPPPFISEPHNSVTGPTGNHPLAALFMSRIHPVKNVDGLLRAWQLVVQSEPNSRLTIAGPGEPALVDSLKRLAETLGIAHAVRFCGFVAHQEKESLFSQTTVFALPSRHENFGLVVLEAIAAGIPVVISREVQLAPFVRENRLGIISGSDPQEFAGALLQAMRDDALRKRVALTGAELVARNYAPAAIGGALTSMYLSALARHNLNNR